MEKIKNKKVIGLLIVATLLAVIVPILAGSHGGPVSSWCDWNGNYSIYVDVKDYNVTNPNSVDYANYYATVRAGHCEKSIRGRVNVSRNIREAIEDQIDLKLQGLEFNPSPFTDEGKHRSWAYTR